MVISDILTKEDLGEPYDRLSDFLDLGDILKLEQTYGGRQLKLKRDCADITKDYPELANMLGLEKARKVILALGGMWMYFPTIRRSGIGKIRAAIVADFNGGNHATLAKKYGYTERHVRRILGGDNNRGPVILEGQLSLLDI